MDEKIIPFPTASSSLKEIRGVILLLGHIKKDCLEQGYEFAAFMIEATMHSIETQIKDDFRYARD